MCSDVRGRGWSLTALFARAGITVQTTPLVRANNGSAVHYEGFSGYGQKLVNTVFDFSWKENPSGLPAPSNQSAFRGMFASGARVLGFDFSDVYDSVIEDIRAVDCPIGLRLVGGGGQNQLSNCTISGLTQVSGQNTAISKSGLFGGLDINGNSENRIYIENTQIFYVGVGGTDPAIPSDKYNFAIVATDSGTYGASLTLENCSVFGNGNCITGKFSSGITARDTHFNYNAAVGGKLLYAITGSVGAVRPVMRFYNCTFPAGGTPLGTNPSEYYWEMHNCSVGGTRVRYASNMDTGSWVATGVGVTLVNNTLGRWSRNGAMATMFCDVSWPVTSSSLPAYITGIPFPASVVAGSSVHVTFYSGGTAGIFIGGYVDTASGTIVLSRLGGPPISLTNADLSGARTMIRIDHLLSD